ncbi:hypothetical protein JOF48_000671 [Arthrobacter stackebrandtii]|uniref:Gram-positive cocci surface proteins LPxTG domain-containing protein n=1 Tax=Arthrobacter stackebrandtii TaxID=272161 RepID=A0ABS4YSV7_9MICC|nr:Ig domain-containing protein [Arthrobacter stackebrandtii]MBP2411872.1 hypothetical protein [Arthrobacter stackebrandtii]PYG99099.1 hypothetical protein CVV67_17035 [Arthrobacter stackebrandtii]
MVSRLRAIFVMGLLLALVLSLASVGAVLPRAQAATDITVSITSASPTALRLNPGTCTPSGTMAHYTVVKIPFDYSGGTGQVDFSLNIESSATTTAMIYQGAFLPDNPGVNCYITGWNQPGGAAKNTTFGYSNAGVVGLPVTPWYLVLASDAPGDGVAAGVSITSSQGTVALEPVPAAPAPLSMTTQNLPDGTVGTAYSGTVAVTGGTPPYTFDMLAGPLPPGLSLNTSTGVISGTPTQAGTSGFGIQVADSAGATAASPIYSVVFAAPSVGIAPSTLPLMRAGTPYSVQITGRGGTAPYSFSSPGLPPGLTLTSAGLLEGTPTTPGPYNIDITATDSSTGQSAPFSSARYYSGTIGDAPSLTISLASLPAGTAYVDYQQALFASGGTAPYTYSLPSGTLPAGMTLSSDGVLSGTPTEAGTFPITVMAQDSSPTVQRTGAANYVLSIAPPAIVLTTPSLPDATAGVGYTSQLAASGGAAPHTFAVSIGSLPAGLQLSTGGMISGTPTAHGSSTFTVTATDTNGFTGAKEFTLRTVPVPLTILPATLPVPTAGAAYTGQLNAAGGIPAYTWSVSAGSLPTGLELNSATGALSGTPTAVGSYTFTATVNDAGDEPFQGMASQKYTVAVPSVPLELSGTLPQAHQGEAYTGALTGSGSTGPYTFALQPAATMPAGLSLDGDGLITGTPEAAATFDLLLTLNDAYGSSSNVTGHLTVAPSIGISPIALPDGIAGAAYEQQLSADGGTAPYTYAVTAGTLPGGVELSADGLLTGTPTVHGSSAFTVTASDADGFPGTTSYTLLVAPAPLVLGPVELPVPTAGTPYSAQLAAAGGVAPYAWSVPADKLPPGLSLDTASGLISGTPTAVGRYTFTVGVADSAVDAFHGTASQEYTLVVPAVPLELGGTLPQAHVGDAYTGALAGSGGTGPYIFALQSGATLPTGLSLDGNGLITGTPDEAGTFDLLLTVTDAYGSSSNVTGQLTVAPNIGIAPAAIPDATVAAAYEQQLSADGGTAPYTFAVTSGTLPDGMELSADGLLTGTPTVHGSSTFTVTASDADGFPGTTSYTLLVAPAPLVLGPVELPVPTAGTPYSAQLTPAGGVGPFSFAVTAGQLPTGLTLDGGTGVISGTPTAVGSVSFTLTTSDAGVGVFGPTGPTGPALFRAAGAAPAPDLFAAVEPVTASQSYTVDVQSAVLSFDGGLPGGQVGKAYSSQLEASGGTGPYTFSLAAGSELPRGLSLSSSGLLTGTPETDGSASFDVSVTDAQGSRATTSLNLVVAPAAPAPTETPTESPAPTETPTESPAPTETPTESPAPTQTPTETVTSSPTQTASSVPATTATTSPAAKAGLPRTGAVGTMWLLGLGGIAVLGGLVVLSVARRRANH